MEKKDVKKLGFALGKKVAEYNVLGSRGVAGARKKADDASRKLMQDLVDAKENFVEFQAAFAAGLNDGLKASAGKKAKKR